MRTVKIWLLALLLASPAAFPLSGNVVATDNVKAHLVSEVSAIAPGQSFWVALEFNIRDGWHTYWRNPGDSGQATTLKWQLPPGFTAGDIVWTTPHRFEIPPLVNYGYAKHAVHLVNITAPRDLKAGAPIVLSAKANDSDVVRALELGAHEYVTKPFDAAALLLTVAHVLSSAPADLEAGRRRRLDQLSSSNRS